jgi:hypothetical protein
MTFLKVLDLSSNLLDGKLPEEIGKCVRLRSVKLNNNSLNGSLPGSVTNLIHLQTTLDVSYNSLSGVIPLDIGKLDMLENINLSQPIWRKHSKINCRSEKLVHTLMFPIIIWKAQSQEVSTMHRLHGFFTTEVFVEKWLVFHLAL